MSEIITLKDISEIPDASNKPLVQVISEPEKIKIISDDERIKILRMIHEGIEDKEGKTRRALSVPEIASKMGTSAPRIYHHIDILVSHGLLIPYEVKKTRRSTTYYMRSASAFIMLWSLDDEEKIETSKNVNELIIQGLDIKISKKDIEVGSELRNEVQFIMNNCLKEVSDKIKDKIPEERLFEILRHLAFLKFIANDENVEKARELSKFYHL
ncbi:MAG: winged helix-turn-helix transcriptional regulator [Candidatus Heimdallarchaeota archaeon]|nr:winged helix-turn-helix transcriptional regulator [Candidatus Heimdallarchaeota archaeon]MCK5048734.1 winged helix-turn-helix transcriptional regulator [Candidatus Heimdallarchaeota archaeon]